MSSQLPPPSGFQYKGSFIPASEREIELLLNIRVLTREVAYARDVMSAAQNAGETNLFKHAQQIRSCQDDLAVAEQSYSDYVRDNL